MFRKKLWIGAAATAAALAAGAVAAAPLVSAQAGESVIVPRKDNVVSAYFANWAVYGRGYYVKDIPAKKLNVIQYAFGNPTFNKDTGAAGCEVTDPWADYQQVYWTGDHAVDGVADDANSGNQHLFGNFNQLLKMKKANPNVKVLISLGGWTKSTWFSQVAATPERRAAVVKACLDTFIKGNLPAAGTVGGDGSGAGVFDGIDIDWEYPTQVAGGNVDPTPADRANATALFSEFRSQLDTLGAASKKHYLLTAAMPAAKNSSKYFQLQKVGQILDWIYVMTYDYNGGWSKKTSPTSLFNSDPKDENAKDPTWNTTGTVGFYERSGVSPDKIVVGVPFYGLQFIRTPEKNALWQPYDNKGLDANSLDFDRTPNPTYHQMVDVAKVLTADGKGQNGFTRKWVSPAGEPWLFSATANHHLCDTFNPDGTCVAPYELQTPTVITYEDPASLHERTKLVSQSGLRGVFAWELSQDSNDAQLMGELSRLLPKK
ncbi:MAG: chitinase [Cryptosporangiaceae bacterium]|nr:chitinase [Cryptosporangiaceae bacterium]